MDSLGIIAGKGLYPQLLFQNARTAGVQTIAIAGFHGETSPELMEEASFASWHRVGQLGSLIKFFKSHSITQVIMAGQITPTRLFDLRPDWRALLVLIRLKKRNAETLFGAVADTLEKEGIRVLPATTFMEGDLAPSGHFAGPRPNPQAKSEIQFGWDIAKQISAMDIGQTVVVKKGTVLAVEGFDGTNATLRRGGSLGKGKATAVKVSKPNQDFRFDVPVIGTDTVRICFESGIRTLACEAKKTLLLDKQNLTELATKLGITLIGI